MKKEYDKFYETEQPELVKVKSGEVRLFHDCQRLAISKPQWKDKEGNYQMGKTVSIDLAANKGNQELIELFEHAIELLKGDKSL